MCRPFQNSNHCNVFPWAGIAHSRQAKQTLSFPRSAWECILDALRPLYWATEIRAQGTQSVPYAFPRRAWERVFMRVCLNLTAMWYRPLWAKKINPFLKYARLNMS